MNALVPLGGAALLFLFLGSSKAQAKPAPGAPVPAPTNKPIAQRMAEVLATRDPNAIRFEAGRLRQEGHPTEAAQLEAAAAELEAQIAAGQAPPPQYPAPAPTPATAPPVVSLPPVTLPPVITVPGVGTIQLPTEPPPLPPIVDPTGPNPTVTIPPMNVPGLGTTPPLTIPLPPVGAPPSSTPPVAVPSAPSAPAPAPAAPAAVDWTSAVPKTLQGVTLKRQTTPAFDARVVLWQQRLVALGYPIGKGGTDGKFGADTEAATKLFQSSNGLTADGIVGAATLAKAVGHPQPPKASPAPAAPKPTATPAAPAAVDWTSAVPKTLQGVTLKRQATPAFDARVVLWQQRLVALGYPIGKGGTDGKFGPDVESATKLFQSSNGLTADGIVGAATLAKAVGHPQPPKASPPPAVSAAPKPTAMPAPAPVASGVGGVPATLQGVVLKRQATPTFDARVVVWQARLHNLGFPAGSDGKFGPTVEAATKAFQTSRHLTADGVVGPATLAAAYGGTKMSGDEEFGRDTFVAPPSPLPDSPIPGVLPPMAPEEPRPGMPLASRLTLMLIGTRAGGEDRTLLRAFQAQEGLRPSGVYGVRTAEALAVNYGIVPPPPRYWGRRGDPDAGTKVAYNAFLETFAQRDPQRAEEWRRAKV